MLNNLLGYFMVWGYDYTVELVEMEQADYRDAIEKGEVDLVLHVDTADADTATWLSTVVESGTVMEGGKPIAASKSVRIAVHPTMSERAPDLRVEEPERLKGCFFPVKGHGPVGEHVVVEGAVYDEDGQLLTGSLLDYAMPRADNFPDIEVLSTTTASPHHPLGVKGIGEAGTIASTAAVYNAAMDVLRPMGVNTIDMPLTPAKVWQAINQASTERRPDPLMKLRLASPALLVDIGHLGELSSGVTCSDGTITIIALTTHATIASSDILRSDCPMLAEAAGMIGDPPLYNADSRPRVGATVAHSDPGLRPADAYGSRRLAASIPS
ncbi:Carbon monoxide dehydrogenase large chain [Geodia barretti]|uniref:Carbon monoxide dehydrogenase large chain n=1 Tax=Geodia barretti TaxID=519541 RepID=A0AA35WF87_GEOBA|nr:Carbon monoxide dehydrogenase large chain [Geodia barretti]